MKTAMLIGEIIVSLWGVGFVYWARFADNAQSDAQRQCAIMRSLRVSATSHLRFILCLLALLAIYAPIVYLGWQIIRVAQ